MPRFDINSNLLDTSANSKITAQMVSAFIKSVHANSPLINDANSFVQHANENGISIFLPVCHAILETGWGFSQDYSKYNNLFGIGHPSYADNGWKFPSVDDCISYYCSWVKRYYLQDPGTSGVDPNQSHWAGAPTLGAMNVHYAEDKTWCGKVAAIMNQMAVFLERYQEVPAVQQTSVLPGKIVPKFYTVVKGGWRYDVIMELIRAGLYQGDWKSNSPKFDSLNPTTPQGGWRAGDKVVYDTYTISSPQVVEIPPANPGPVVVTTATDIPVQVEQTIQHIVSANDTLGNIFRKYYGRYPNWTDWSNKKPTGDLQRMINFIKAHGGRVDVNPKTGREDIIHINSVLTLPKNI